MTVASDVAAFVRGALPEPPARVLEIGAGDGALAALLREGGYNVVAIDPAGDADGVVPVALADLDEPRASFAAAFAVVSLHHVEPLAESLRRLADLLPAGAPLVVDELDATRYDERAAAWWLAQRAAAGEPHESTPAEMVAGLSEHIRPVADITAELANHFTVGPLVPGPYLHRWHLDHSLRPLEERLIASGAIPATGVRFVAVRR